MTRDWHIRLLRRLALTACDKRHRRWVDDLFAELEAIEGRRTRLGWLRGATWVVTASTIGRIARTATDRIAAAIVLCLAVSLSMVAVFWQGYEVRGLDDDWFGAGSVAVIALLPFLLRRARAAPMIRG